VGCLKWCCQRYSNESMATTELKSSRILTIYIPFIIHIYMIILFRQQYMYNCPWAMKHILNGWSLTWTLTAATIASPPCASHWMLWRLE
jgi:hypothetical protein